MSWDESIRDSLQHAAPFITWVVLALATSILVAVIRDPLCRVLREAREQLRALRLQLSTRSAIRFTRQSQRFWLARQHEPARTVAAALDRLADALPQVGKRSLARVTTVQAELNKQLTDLEALGFHPLDPGPGPTDAPLSNATPGGTWWRILLLGGIAVLTGAANSFLLNEFFQGVITSGALFPSALPDFHVSNVFAVLIFMMEVAIGFALHHFAEDHNDDSPARKLLALAPWVVLAGLVCLEGWAYALLSYQIDIPERLNLSPNGGLYTFARYFLAVFGAGLTLLLSSLGYLLGKEVDRLHAGRAARRQERLLKRHGWAIAQGADQVQRTERALVRLKETVQSFQVDLVHQFKSEVNVASSSEDLATAVEDALFDTLDSARRVTPVRTRAQALADLSLFTTVLALLIVVTWVSVEYVAAFVRGVQGNRPSADLFALVSGVVLTGFALLAGYVAGHGMIGRRRFLRGLAVVFLLTAGAALSAVAVANRTLGPATGLNVLFGLLHAGILAIVGAAADAALVNTLHLLRLAGLYLGRSIASLGVVVLWLAGAVVAVLDWLVRLAAVFGQLVVRPRPAVRFGVAEVSRSSRLPRELRPPARRFTDKAYVPATRAKHD